MSVVTVKPAVAPARELPVYAWSEWQSVAQVKSAIKALELGMFDASSQVIDAMGRDDRIEGVLSTRAGALPSLPISFDPRGDGRMKKAVAADVEENFETMFPDDALTALLAAGIMGGLGLGQLTWERKDRWVPKLNVWHTRFLHWRWDTNSLWTATTNGQVEVKPGDGQWVVFAPYGIKRGWMKGKVRSLYVPWLIRQWGMRDWARYSEVHGMPIRKAVMPEGAQDEDKARFLKEVANLGQESIIRTPRVAPSGQTTGDTSRFDVELIEAVGRSEESFDKLLAMASTNVAIALLGQNLSTEVKGGSFAATLGHMQIRNDILQGDAENLGNCLRQQCLGPYAQVNYGSAELAPMPKWKTKPPDDRVQKGLAVKNLGDGLAALKRVGAKPDIDKMLDADEIPVTGPAEDVDINALENPAPEPVDPKAGPGAGGGAARRPAKLPRPVARASQATEDELPDALVEGQLYVDELATNGTQLGAKALRPDLQAVLEVVQEATTFEELSDGLRKRYAKMSRKSLAKLLNSAMQLAELAGRESVLEETRED